MEERNYYLGFSLVSGIGPKRFISLLKTFKTAKNAWLSSELELKEAGLGNSFIQNLAKFRKEFDFDNYLQKMKKANVSFAAICDKEYPKLLKELDDPPIVLFYKGDMNALQDSVTNDAEVNTKILSLSAQGSKRLNLKFADSNESSESFVSPRAAQFLPIAIVGTRKITSYGREVTKLFATDLALNGFTIVSGLAMGVDAVAGWSAIQSGGKTVAVLGSGIDLCFPPVNEPLYDKIIKDGGVVVSEFPMGMQPNAGTFPSRNRIIAGLSLGVLVTEGAEDSGALITADEAIKINRPAFAIPGPITSSLSKGPLNLIAKGGKLVTSAQDIIKIFNSQFLISNQTPIFKTQNPRFQNLSKDELKIVQLLENEGLSFDEIVRRSKLNSSEAGSLLSMMEIKGIIKNSGGLLNLSPEVSVL